MSRTPAPAAPPPAAEVTPTSRQRDDGGSGSGRPTMIMSPSRHRSSPGQGHESSSSPASLPPSARAPRIMSRCQAIVTALLAWMSIVPLLTVGAGLVYKPSLILHSESNDNDDVDPLVDNDQYSFLILLAGGVLLGQAILHIFLLLPLTGDACCCCFRCCFPVSSYAIGIRPFSVYVSRMASLATAWTSLVLLTLTFWTLHLQFQREHGHHPNNNGTILVFYDDGNRLHDNSDDHHYNTWSNDTYVLLLTASATSLALATLSLVVSLLPCYSPSRRVSNGSHQLRVHYHNNDQEAALRQPLLHSSTPPRRGPRSRPSPRRVEEGVV
jgi:hypothetical protein